MRGGLSSKERNQDRAAGNQEQNGLELCAQNRSVLQPLVVLVFPTSHSLPSSFLSALQIFAIKEENNRLRQEKQVLKNKLEELKKRELWNDPVMVTECVWALGSAGKGTNLAGEAAGKCSWALCDDWNSSSARARSSGHGFGIPSTARH